MRGLLMLVLLAVMPVGICRGDDEERGEPAENVLVTAWAEKLSAAFRKGGDRVLVYEAVKPGLPAIRFRVAECQSQQVGAVRMESGGELGTAMGWFTPADGGKKSMHALLPDGEVIRVAGFDRLVDELAALSKVMGKESERKPLGLDWTLYLTVDTLIFNVGVNSVAADRRAPWLKEELLVAATDVELGKDEIVFVFPGNGKVVVRKDGVLLRQEFPVDGVDRKLRLVREEKLEEWSVEEYFAKFDPANVRVEAVGAGQRGAGLVQGFYLELIQGLAEMEDAGEKLGEWEEEMVERMVPIYRPLARRAVKADAKLAKARIDMEIKFGQAWEEAQRKFPEEVRLMTYGEFIESIRKGFVKRMVETGAWDVGGMLPPVLDPKVRAGLTVKELVVADQFRELGAQAMAKAIALEIFEAAAANEKKRGLE